MLPDFPNLNAEFERAIIRHMRQRAALYERAFEDVPRYRVFEGHGTAIYRADGSGESSDFFEASSEVEIPTDELVNMSLDDLLQRLEKNTQELAETKAKHFFETISAAVEKAGTAFDAMGKPLTAELYLEVIQTLWIEFNPDGTARLPTLIVSPDKRDAAIEIHKKLGSDPDLKRRFEKILEAKREEWRAREADRELVG